MDIRNWSMDQVMQLPDNCFGTRRVITMCGEGIITNPAFNICETGLSERTVVWGVSAWHHATASIIGTARFALGDKLPATLAEFDAMEDMFPEMSYLIAYRSILAFTGYATIPVLPMRRLFQTAGRRIVCAFGVVGLSTDEVCCGITISSVPREVPDCLLSV